MESKLKYLIEELKEKLTEFKKEFEKIFEYQGIAFYQKKYSGLLKDLRAIWLKLKKIEGPITKKSLKMNIKKIISSLETLITSKTIVHEDVSENLEQVDLSIQELEIEFEENDEGFEERVYDKGSRFDFHVDVKEILKKAKKEILIIEPFVNEHLLEITLKGIDKKLCLKILTNSRNADKRGKFAKLATMLKAQQTGGLETRETEDVHDRGLFIDGGEGWVLGQSIKDGANKPTYIIKLKEPNKLREIYKQIWNYSKKVV